MLYWTCLLLVLAPLLLECVLLRQRRAKIPVRIHVHGTRGKSSVTRALAAALRAQGLRVLAKTTGDRPECVLPCGTVVPVRRLGPARIQEHVRILGKAAAMGVDAVVVEGMALQPETVFLSERVLRATHAVVTNVRPDHAETMGPGSQGVLRTLRHMIPVAGELFTADEAGAESLASQAAGNGIPCHVVSAPAAGQAPALARAVADAVLRRRGIPPCRDAAEPEPFVLPRNTEVLGMPVRTYDFLSANDVVSSRHLLEACTLRGEYLSVALLATRADRPLRTRGFLDWLLLEERFDAVAAMGGHAGYALLRGALCGDLSRFLRVRPGLSPDRLLCAMRTSAVLRGRAGLTVVAFGNAHGYGELWRKALQSRGVLSSPAGPCEQQGEGVRHAY